MAIERALSQTQISGGNSISAAQQAAKGQSKPRAVATQAGLGKDTLNLTILGTTDVHGHIYPTNYFHDQGNEPFGLARVSTLVKQIRAQKEHTLLVDSGDALEGTPLLRFNAEVDKQLPNPMIAAMNAMKYDVFAVGNHEYNFGLDYLQKARNEAQFPFLSGNVFKAGTKDPIYTPYIIKDVEGAKIAFLGFTTPGVAIWDGAKVKGKQDFGDIVEAAKRWIPEIKAKGADAIVVVIHSGLGAPYDSTFAGYSTQDGVPPENVCATLADACPEIDAILLGHSHKDLPKLERNGVLLTQADKWGDRLAEVDLKLARQDGKWKVVGKDATTIKTGTVAPDPEILAVARQAHEETIQDLNKPIGHIDREWSAARSRVEETPIIDLINTVQRQVMGADLSAASVLNESARLPAGQLTTADIASLYVYENTLTKIEVTGKQLKEYLEHAASCFNTYQPGGEVFDRSIPAYNQDMVQGVNYTIDVRQPAGQRIRGLTWQGKPVGDEQQFTMAVNNYRQSGGGGFTSIKNAPVLAAQEDPIREMIIDYVKTAKDLTPAAVMTHNWKIVPEGAIAPDGKHFN